MKIALMFEEDNKMRRCYFSRAIDSLQNITMLIYWLLQKEFQSFCSLITKKRYIVQGSYQRFRLYLRFRTGRRSASLRVVAREYQAGSLPDFEGKKTINALLSKTLQMTFV